MQNKKRLEKQILILISEIIEEDIENINLSNATSIIEVELNNDNSIATIYVDFYKNPNRLLEEIRNASGFIKSILSKKLNMRKVPMLQFELDKKLAKLNEIERLLEESK